MLHKRSITAVVLVLLIAGCSADSSDIASPPQEGPPLATGSVVVNRSAVLLTGVGQSRQLSVQTKDGSGSTVNAGVVWSSSAPDQVSVDASGRVTAGAIGSAMVFATSGAVKSAPVFVVVAEPQPGALVVSDDQVVAVGPPLGVGPNDIPGLGTRYEVRLTGVATPPAPGTVVLAAENAPVAGTVVSTRNESGALVVTLALRPLSELLARYDINWNIDLAAFPAVLDLTPPRSPNAYAPRVIADPRTSRPDANIIQPFTALSCEASLAPVLASKTLQLAPNVDLQLDFVESPVRTRRAVVGSLKMVGKVALKLNAGFKVSGGCLAQVLIRIPVGGPLALGIMPGVRIGVGVSLEGQIFVTAGELSATGEVGTEVEMGYECGGTSATCQGLDRLTPINKDTVKFEVLNPVSGMRVELQGQIYLLVGLDAVLFTAWTIPLVEAKAGPVQSVDLGWEEDQALNPGYSSKYDLKLEAVVEPGSGVNTLIDWFFGGRVLSFQAKVSTTLSESPKGTLTVSRPVASISGGPVELRVDLTNTDYFMIGYNVVHVELWQKRAEAEKFTKLRTFDVTASNQTIFTHSWQPTIDDFGTNKFAVFVYTRFPVPGLEIADNSIREVDVKCFTAPRVIATTVAEANSCADTWEGTATFDWPGELHIDAIVTWTRDPANPENAGGGVYYVARGFATVKHLGWEAKGCSVSQTAYDVGPPDGSSYLFVDYKPSPPSFEGNGSIAGVSKLSCPDAPDIDYAFGWLWFQGAGPTGGSGTIVEGTQTLGEATWRWRFVRQ